MCTLIPTTCLPYFLSATQKVTKKSPRNPNFLPLLVVRPLEIREQKISRIAWTSPPLCRKITAEYRFDSVCDNATVKVIPLYSSVSSVAKKIKKVSAANIPPLRLCAFARKNKTLKKNSKINDNSFVQLRAFSVSSVVKKKQK
jgi:hypothetical protein